MDAIRKVVDTITGDAGTEHGYPSRTEGTDRPVTGSGVTSSGIPPHQGASGVGSGVSGVSRSPEEATLTGRTRDTSPLGYKATQTETTGPTRGVEERGGVITSGGLTSGGVSGVDERERERGTVGVPRPGESSLRGDEERQKAERERTQQLAERERQLSGKEGPTRTAEESKPLGQKMKEAIGIGGAGSATMHEEQRQLGYEKGQHPYPYPREAEEAQRLRDEAEAAMQSGRPYSGWRLKEPEYRREYPYERKHEEWAAGGAGYRAERGAGGGITGGRIGERGGYEQERGGYEQQRGGGYEQERISGRERGREERGYGRERGRDEGVLSRTLHTVQDAASGVFGGVTGAVLGRSINLESRSRFPICLRALIKPRPDLHDSKIEGDVLFVQEAPNKPTQVIGSIRGVNPGLHGLCILEHGDLTLGRASAGLHFDAPGSRVPHGGANTDERHLGDLGNVVVKDDGVSFFSFTVDHLPLIDVAGRSLAVMSGEDDLGQSFCRGDCGHKCGSSGSPRSRCGDKCPGEQAGCHACLSETIGNAGHALGLGTIFRTDLLAMERLKNVRLGVGQSEPTHREVWGRPMHKREELYRGTSGKMMAGGERRETGEESTWGRWKEALGFGHEQQRRSPERGYGGYERTRGYDEPSRSGFSQREYGGTPRSSQYETQTGSRWEPSEKGRFSGYERGGEDIGGKMRYREHEPTASLRTAHADY